MTIPTITVMMTFRKMTVKTKKNVKLIGIK